MIPGSASGGIVRFPFRETRPEFSLDSGVTADLGKAQAKWTANADEIAAFLSGANPHWTKAMLADMLHKHLEYTTNEVVSRLKMDWKGDVVAYDAGHIHMLMFADILTEGIVAQFPDKFKM